MHPKDAQAELAGESNWATVLRDQRIAKYKVRLENSQRRPSVTPEARYEEPVQITTAGPGILRGAGHCQPLHPDRSSRPGRLASRAVPGQKSNRGPS